MTSRTPCPRHTPRWLLCVLLFSGLLAQAAHFDIPAQAAAPALKAFITQSKAQVTYRASELEGKTSREVKGNYEPAAALTLLLEGTGFTSQQRDSGIFVVTPIDSRPGSIDGSVRDESGKPVAGAKVALADSDKVVATDKRGRFVITDVPAGAHVLQITADGLQNTRVTDVTVNAGRELSMSPITIPVRKQGTLELETYSVSAKKNDGALELDPYAVSGQRAKPFVNGNIDIPRTISDAQPYYIFDSNTINHSGAVNVEDFLKLRLTMNTVAQTNSQRLASDSTANQASTINLRGLGPENTLILVNGRRVASTKRLDSFGQPDLNGVPMSAIDRIEVLPTSASAIYGGSALGGMINVVLKKSYTGGELRLSYGNTESSDAPIESASLTYGQSLESGKTQVSLTVHGSRADPLVAADRAEIFLTGTQTVLKNNPSLIYARQGLFLGSTPNIASALGTPLTLRDGTPLNATITSVGHGTTVQTSQIARNAALLQNAGTFNLELPPTAQAPTGLKVPLGSTPKVKGLMLSVRREMNSWLELFSDYSFTSNRGYAARSAFGNSPVLVFDTSPVNPFREIVYTNIVDTEPGEHRSNTDTESFTLGTRVSLSKNWIFEADFTHSRTQNDVHTPVNDMPAIAADVASGLLDPFVDSFAASLNLSKYRSTTNYIFGTTLSDVAVRGSGRLDLPLSREVTLAFGLEQRKEASDNGYFTDTNQTKEQTTYFGRSQVTDSIYAEANLSLVQASDKIPLIHALNLQIAGRQEWYKVGTGTQSVVVIPGNPPTLVRYTGPTLNGSPFSYEAKYSSINPTLAIKYEMLPGLILRSSYSTAFLPPTHSQLVPNPLPNTNLSTINDPKLGIGYGVTVTGGGNPDLTPTNSESWNGGILWTLTRGPFAGVRLGAEYYNIIQNDKIGSLSVQQLVTAEATFPERISRDTVTGRITKVNSSLLNLTRFETEGWDFTATYYRKFRPFTVEIAGAASIISHENRQTSLGAPLLDYVGWVNRGGEVKSKTTLNLTLQRGAWSAGWTTRINSSYHQNGAVGDPVSLAQDILLAQGGSGIPAQEYHDAWIGYSSPVVNSEGRFSPKTLLFSGLTVQIGVKNLFNRVPPFDAFYSPFYYSPYGDVRLREYWISIRKAF